MEHSFMWSIVIGIIVILLFLIFLKLTLFRNLIDVEPHDYLEVISYHIWKTAPQIQKEMEKLKGGLLSPLAVYDDLDELIHEGLVEIRVIDREGKRPYPDGSMTRKVRQYKLTSDGIRRKHELATAENLPNWTGIKPI